MINRQFVMTGRLDKNAHLLLQKLYERRLEDDYERLTPVTADEAEAAIRNAEIFISLIKPLLAERTPKEM